MVRDSSCNSNNKVKWFWRIIRWRLEKKLLYLLKKKGLTSLNSDSEYLNLILVLEDFRKVILQFRASITMRKRELINL
jgi:hypothetical protein